MGARPEETYVVEPFVKWLCERYGYEYVDPDRLDRESPRSVILRDRLEGAIQRLNPWIPQNLLRRVVGEVMLSLERPARPDLVDANRVVYERLIRGVGVRVESPRHNTVRLFDFNNPGNNDFVVTKSAQDGPSFVVAGEKREIKPDIVVFVNGIPLVVVEAKSPTLVGKDPIEEAVSQLERYQEEAPQLFYTNLFLVATCGQDARYGPVGGEFKEWNDEEIREKLRDELGREPTPQEVLLEALFPKGALLDYLRNFVVFANEHGRWVKKIGRYQQVRAVNKAVESALRVMTVSYTHLTLPTTERV